MCSLFPNYGKRKALLGSCQQLTGHIDLRYSQDLEIRYSLRKRSTKTHENICRKHINFSNCSHKNLICEAGLAG